ncbi:hypothetical protein BJ742DRAFT_792274 [Cladochytrium replicatum]|nr:hypothetical protein BJ742DRAFT_792274 [Cladochytrium replicatum]
MLQDPDAIVGFTPEEFEKGIDLVFYTSITFIPLNLTGSLYVLYRVLSMTFKSTPREIPGSLRLPFYVVFIDTLCALTFTAEMISLYISRKPAEPPISHILGGCVTFVIISNFVLITQAAFNSWYRVVRKKTIDTGPYDWKLLLPTVLVPGTIVGVFAYLDVFGANNYIAWMRKSSRGPAVFVAIMVLLSMVTIWYLYVAIMIEIFKMSRGSFFKTIISYRPSTPGLAGQGSGERVEVMDSRGNSAHQRSNDTATSTVQMNAIERQAVLKICMYMMACFIQYLPGCPYALSFLAPSQPYILYILALVSINSGGIVNATALILNEGLGRRLNSVANPGTTQDAEASADGGFKSTNGNEGTTNWGQAPSFNGILANSNSNGSFGVTSTASHGSSDGTLYGGPVYQMQTQTMYPNSKPPSVPLPVPRSTQPSYEAPRRNGGGAYMEPVWTSPHQYETTTPQAHANVNRAMFIPPPPRFVPPPQPNYDPRGYRQNDDQQFQNESQGRYRPNEEPRLRNELQGRYMQNEEPRFQNAATGGPRRSLDGDSRSRGDEYRRRPSRELSQDALRYENGRPSRELSRSVELPGSRAASEYSGGSYVTVVDLGSGAVTEAYANVAKYQQRRAANY